jgi:flavin reductase (DIM6/NTAB) family NADH-FMN oxidoreductase RutF
VDKFAATGLTAGKAQHVRPPIIEECIAHLECRVVQEVEAGDHHFVIGEVLAAYARPGVLDDSGLYDLSHVQLLFHLGGNRFTSTLGQSVEQPLPKQ